MSPASLCVESSIVLPQKATVRKRRGLKHTPCPTITVNPGVYSTVLQFSVHETAVRGKNEIIPKLNLLLSVEIRLQILFK